MSRNQANTPRENNNIESSSPAKANEILGDFSTKIEDSLNLLEEKFNEAKISVADLIKDIPFLNKIFSDFITESEKLREEINGLSASELDTRVMDRAEAISVELTTTQREIYSWSRESINFWNNNLPNGVPALPPRSIGWLFGIFESESSFRVDAANSRSSARGLGQFLTRTWNGYIDRYGNSLVAAGVVTQDKLNNPNARTENPRLMVYMTTRYIINSYQALSRNGLVPQGWDTPDIEFMLYIIHHHGSGDGPKYLRYYKLPANSPERENIRRSMKYPHLLDWNPTDSYGRTTANRMQSWVDRFSSGNS